MFVLHLHTLYNQYTAEYQTSEEKNESEYTKVILHKLIQNLTETEKIILKMSFGIGYDKTYDLAEIAQVLDYTSERVRQLKIKALDKLKKEK